MTERQVYRNQKGNKSHKKQDLFMELSSNHPTKGAIKLAS